MLLEKEKSGLVLVDVQEKLTPHIFNSIAVVERCQWLIRLAKELTIPLVVSEQYPRGLGSTVDALQPFISSQKPVEKVTFSCYRESTFIDQWKKLEKQQVVLMGIETHVCVLQTAIEMHQAGFDVFVVVDAVSSRQEFDKKYALKRMKQVGITLVTSEMVFFEWVGQAGTPAFKALSQAYLQ